MPALTQLLPCQEWELMTLHSGTDSRLSGPWTSFTAISGHPDPKLKGICIWCRFRDTMRKTVAQPPDYAEMADMAAELEDNLSRLVQQVVVRICRALSGEKVGEDGGRSHSERICEWRASGTLLRHNMEGGLRVSSRIWRVRDLTVRLVSFVVSCRTDGLTDRSYVGYTNSVLSVAR